MLKGPPVDPSLRYSTPTLPGVAIPSTLETGLGTLLGLPPVNQLANRSAILTMGPANRTVPIWENLIDSRTVELTANDNIPYTWFWLDLRQGPLVLEVPPRVLGLINDMWYRARRQVSTAGPRLRRAGAQWLLSGPTVHLQRLGGLEEAGNPTTPRFVNMSGRPFAPDATARARASRMRDRQGYIFKDANWRNAFFGGYTFEWQPGVANLDAAAFFFPVPGVTPAMDTTIVGEGST